MKFSKYYLFTGFLFIIGCSSIVSTSNRYSTFQKTQSETVASSEPQKAKNDSVQAFDFKPFASKFSFSSKDSTASIDSSLWYSFPETQNGTASTKAAGYRVMVLSTENIDEAKNFNDSIKAFLPTNKTYIKYETPFYKVKVGDLQNFDQASDLKFKLKQIGFKSAIIMQDSILVRAK